MQWSVKTDDFFPYSDAQHAFWAGYFTSRPTLKYFERIASSLLQTLKQVTASPSPAVRSMRTEIDKAVFQLTAAVGLINHHDAITGTSKQHVADDYFKILSKAMTVAEEMIGKVFSRTAVSNGLSGSQAVDEKMAVPAFTMCRMQNESICEPTQSLRVGDTLMVTVYNPLPRTRSQQVGVSLNTDAAVVVTEITGGHEHAVVPSEMVPNQNRVTMDSAMWTLVFTAKHIPALTSSRFLLRLSAHPTNARSEDAATVLKTEKLSPFTQQQPFKNGVITDGHRIISNDKVAVHFNANSGLLEKIVRVDTLDQDGKPLSADVSQDFAFYKSFGSPGSLVYYYATVNA